MTDVYSHPDYQQFLARIRERPDDAAGNLPDDVFDKIGEMSPDARMIWTGPSSNQHLSFPTADAARLALSRALHSLSIKSEVSR